MHNYMKETILMNIKRIVTSVYTENCYIFWDKANNGGVIDPGSDFNKIDTFITENKINIRTILLTHSHFDHIGAAEELSKKYGISVKMAYSEKEVLEEPENSLEVNFEVPEKIEYFREGDIINIGDIRLKVIETPGHTKGSVCFYEEKEKILFAGDTLFRTTVGRWDLPTGSYKDLEDSIKNKLYILPDDVKVHSGHGFSTTIGKEKGSNGVIRC